MGRAVTLRADFDGPELRLLAKSSKDAGQSRRLLALAAIYDGGKRLDAARIGSVGLQGVRDWVLRFNAKGPDGLIDGNWLSNRIFKSEDEIVSICSDAWNRPIDQPWKIMSIGRRKWAHGF